MGDDSMWVIAKSAEKCGSLAVQMGDGGEVVRLKRECNRICANCTIEIMTISRPSACLEYAPYEVVETPCEFKRRLYGMVTRETE